MIRSPRYVACLFIAFFILVPLHFVLADKEAPVRSFAKLKRGMTPEQVHQLVGAPKHITRQLFYHRYREQWLYDTPGPFRLTFDCPRGQKPQLLDEAEPRP